MLTCQCFVVSAGDLNSMCEVKGAPVDMMVFVLDADDNLVTFSEQRDDKGVSTVSVLAVHNGAFTHTCLDGM